MKPFARVASKTRLIYPGILIWLDTRKSLTDACASRTCSDPGVPLVPEIEMRLEQMAKMSRGLERRYAGSRYGDSLRLTAVTSAISSSRNVRFEYVSHSRSRTVSSIYRSSILETIRLYVSSKVLRRVFKNLCIAPGIRHFRNTSN